jgi:hypothetical protein
MASAAPTAAGTTAEALQRLSVSIDALDREDNRLALLDASSATEQARASGGARNWRVPPPVIAQPEAGAQRPLPRAAATHPAPR